MCAHAHAHAHAGTIAANSMHLRTLQVGLPSPASPARQQRYSHPQLRTTCRQRPTSSANPRIGSRQHATIRGSGSDGSSRALDVTSRRRLTHRDTRCSPSQLGPFVWCIPQQECMRCRAAQHADDKSSCTASGVAGTRRELAAVHDVLRAQYGAQAEIGCDSAWS